MFSKFAAQIRETIQKHQMLLPGDRVLVGVSGGADSVCLALVLTELRYQLGIAHVNHGLRGAASDDDAAFTATLAQRLGLIFFTRRVLLIAGNIEAAGR
ncbi:MAG: tRNA(Ile)-lysidine synthetase, partial [Acidobacteria bacterium]